VVFTVRQKISSVFIGNMHCVFPPDHKSTTNLKFEVCCVGAIRVWSVESAESLGKSQMFDGVQIGNGSVAINQPRIVPFC